LEEKKFTLSRTCAAIFPDTLYACPRAIRKPSAFITRREKIEHGAGIKHVLLWLK
jgi:hypothetical protein